MGFMNLPQPLVRYLEPARNGRNQVWRILLGAVLVGLVWVVVSGLAALPALLGSDTGIDGTPDTPIELAVVLASFIGIWVGVWLALRLVHRRPVSTVLGSAGRMSIPDLLRGFTATFAVAVLAEAATYILDPSLERTAIPVALWLAWLLPLVLFVLIQVSAEELAFRGYLMQSLAARFSSPAVWIGIPTVIFTVLHYDPVATPWMNGSIFVSIAAFALAAVILVVRTGDLGAATGVHLALNVFGLLVVSRYEWLSGAALFQGTPLTAPGWTAADAVIMALLGILMMVLVLAALLHRRSPLRVGNVGEA